MPTDNGTTEQQSMSATVTVGIVDVNDNAPEIVAVTPSALSLREDASSQRLPVNIVVTDEDSGENGQVTCQCVLVAMVTSGCGVGGVSALQ